MEKIPLRPPLLKGERGGFNKFMFFILILSIFLLPSTAHAYLDPGTGSMILQIVVGSVLAAVYTVKVYWQKIKAFFRKKDPS
ncbi:MAG: hypothetical protein A2048_03385 [Deltaproteobacteria bacterium GWA2_45_12]|nr:MAG: hypothetical protein A2048_03385 [Deltaproteobacteria bacterium GWA2_45_12]